MDNFQAYFTTVAEVYNKRGFHDQQSEEDRRFKAYYNMTKSALLLQWLTPGEKVLDLGCGNGTEILKYEIHHPNAVVLVDISQTCIDNATKFSLDKHITYDLACVHANIATEALFARRVQCWNARMSIKRTLLLQEFALATTFCVLESIPSIPHLEHLVQQIFACLKPGGVWVGCMIDTQKLLDRLDNKDQYQDIYSKFTVKGDWYEMLVHGRKMLYNLQISPSILQETARNAGFVQMFGGSLPSYLAELKPTSTLNSLKKNMQLDRRYRMKLSDLRALSMLRVFSFRRPS